MPISSTFRPLLPYQSRSLSNSWAVDNFDQEFPQDVGGRLLRTGQQLTGARFPNGRVQAIEASHYSNLMVARAMVDRQTVNEYHVNLESKSGQTIKQQMGLPFKAHSRVDPAKAAKQAERDHPRGRDSIGSIIRHQFREGMLEAGLEAVASIGGIGVGMLLYGRHRQRAAGEQFDLGKFFRRPGRGGEEAADGLKSFSMGRVFGRGAKEDLGLAAETRNGVRVFRGVDPNDAFRGQTVTHLAEAEIWAHGAPKGPSREWNLLGVGKTTQPTADVVRQLIAKEKVQSVLIDSCNVERSVIPTPQGAQVTYGLGYGVASSQEREGIGAVRSWLDAVVVSEGDTAKVYPKAAMQAELERRGLDTRGLPTHKLRTVKGDFLEGDTSTLGVYRTAAGETRLTAHSIGQTTEEVSQYSLALHEAPAITLRHGKNGPSFETGGKSFSAFEEASASLTQSIQARSRASAGASRLLQSAGLVESEATVLKSFDTAGQVAQNVAKETRGAFHGPALLGILAAGVLVAGGLMLHHGHAADPTPASNQHPSPEPRHKKHEQHETATQVESRQGGTPRSNTKIRLSDADFNMDEVDRMFTAHLQRGYAVS